MVSSQNNASKKERIQLLSPVGSFDALIAAVSNGADAVYLGTKAFNARRLANNFRTEELKKAIQYAHYNNVKVYVTLNTLIKNHEITGFLKQLSIIASLGADAVILQDLSFAPLIKEQCPSLEVHVSTQATIMNSLAVKFYQQYVDVFVLARELTHSQIKEIKQRTGANLEVFAHGHLCISYSGQCLISSLIGKRSGNRGMCASSCRKQYNGNSYLISAKDLCTIETIAQFVDSGVSTLKIEGRMKSPEYVATTTREYRKQIDLYYQGQKKEVTKEQITDLKLAFNRNFTKGYFNDEKQIVDPIISSKRGILLGTVKEGKLLLQEDLELFDGVSTVVKGERTGAFIRSFTIINSSRAEVELKEASKALKGETVQLQVPGFYNGAKVYLNSKHQGRNLLGHITKIPLKIVLEIKNNEKPKVQITVGEKMLERSIDIIAEPAIKHPLSSEELTKRFEKLDSKIFELKSVTVNTDNSFVPKSLITKFISTLEEDLLEEIAPKSREACEIKISKEWFDASTLQKEQKNQSIAQTKELHVQLYSISQLKKILLEGKTKTLTAVYFPLLNPDFRTAKLLCESAKIQLIASTPMLMVDTDLENAKEIICKNDVKNLLINNVGMLGLCKELRSKGHKCLSVILGYQMNLFNNWQFEFYQKNGITGAVASIELSAKELSAFTSKDKILYYCHGRPIVMTFKEQIAARSLEDHEGYTFPLRKGETGSTQMLYSKKIGILQYIPELTANGISKFFIDLEVQDDAVQIIKDYSAILEGKQVSIKRYKASVTLGNLRKAVF